MADGDLPEHFRTGREVDVRARRGIQCGADEPWGSLQELRHIPRCNPLSGDKTGTARIALLADQRPLEHTRRNSVRQRAAQSSVRRAR
jgi:hypothetical protein